MPKELKVGAMVYSVEINNEYLEGVEAHGATNNNTLEIRLNDEMPLLKRQETALHEAIHALNKVYCQGAELQEEQVAGLAGGLLQVMHDNPDYIRFILAR